jgi:hypothetical protein
MLMLVGGAATASGATITFAVSGTVDFVHGDLTGEFAVGDILNLTYTFESTTAPRTGSTEFQAVFDALTALSLDVDGYLASSLAALEIQVDDDVPGPDGDRYAVVSRATDGLTGPPVNGFDLELFGFRLDDSTETVFSTALDLPTALDLNDFDSTAFFLFFEDGRTVSGLITSVETVQAVPEPPHTLLLGLAVLASTVVVRQRYLI